MSTLPGFMTYLFCTSRLSLILLLVIACHPSPAQSQAPSIDVRIKVNPFIDFSMSRPTTYYEVWITNTSPDSLFFSKLTITNDKQDTCFSAKANDFNTRWALQGDDTGTTTLAPGREAVVYVELTSMPGRVHEKLIHILTCSDRAGKTYVWRGQPMQAPTNAMPALGPPLKGGSWVAVYSPDWVRGHRRVIYTTAVERHIPGRYAIDFIRLNDKAQFAVSNSDSVRNWLGYDAPVLAVADGVVASVRTTFSESATLSGHKQPGAADATGNYISLQIGEHQFVFYEHLKPGSITVKPGQQVKRGDIIAALGFTGQSTGPHLHFHVADVDSPLGAEGIPFVFGQFEARGYYADLDEFGRAPWLPYSSNIAPWRKHERPASNQVIVFEE